MTPELLEHKYGQLMFLKCCRYWPIHAAHLMYVVGRCHICNQQMEIVSNEQEIQRLRHTATRLSKGFAVRSRRRGSRKNFFSQHIKRLIGGKNRQVQEWSNGGGDKPNAPGEWNLDTFWD